MREELIEERLKKLEALKEAGVDPYPARVKRTLTLREVEKDFNKLVKARKKVWLAGRLFSLRDQGSIIFGDLVDESGKLQLVLKKEDTKQFGLWQENLDRGDFVSVSGTLFVTKRGQRSLAVRELVMAAKATRPIPDTYYGLSDTETLLRKRYLDLLIHPELKELFYQKRVFWQTMRRHMEDEGFLEVETPVFEATPGGAEAEPFITHHNALDEDFYLRISLELNLKRLMVGGFEKVFEIGRIFRNEGISAEHLQDYTQMEMYWAYQDYEGLMKFIETMMKKVIKSTFGTLTTTRNGQKINWSKKWPRVDYGELFYKANKLDVSTVTTTELLKRANQLNIDQADETLGRGRLIDLVYKKTVRPNLIQPSFLINPPVIIEPLAKRKPDQLDRVERFQIVAAGTELGKGFSELNDPIDQRERFEGQMQLREAGDNEAQMMDEDYIEAMEYGMPPVAGFGCSERLFSVLVDKPVREAVLFPLLREKE